MKKIYLFLIIAGLLTACAKTDQQMYSFYRKYYRNVYLTQVGGELRTGCIKDYTTSSYAYYAKIYGEFTDIGDTIKQHGHVWSTKDPMPIINKKDTTTYSRLGKRNPGQIGVFETRISELKPETTFWVRSYIITAKGDTGYNQLVLCDTSAAPINEWFKRKNFVDSRTGSCVFTIYHPSEKKEVAYLFGGNDASSCYADLYQYIEEEDRWVKKALFPGQPRTQAVATSIIYKNKNTTYYRGFIGLGQNQSKELLKDWWSYDILTDSWAKKGDFEGFPRTGAVAFTINEKAYVGTGNSGINPLADFYSYDPKKDTTNGMPWKLVAPLTQRTNAVVFNIDGKPYVGTGDNQQGVTFNDLWLFIPEDNANLMGTWINRASMPTDAGTRTKAVGLSIEGQGYIGLGYGNVIVNGQKNTDEHKDFWRYDPYNDHWYRCTDFKIGPDFPHYPDSDTTQFASDAFSFGIGDKGFVGCGIQILNNQTKFTKYIWVYRPW